MWLESNNNWENNQEIDWMSIEIFTEKYPDLYTLSDFDRGVIVYDYYLQELLIWILLNKKIYFYDHITEGWLIELNQDAEKYIYWINKTVNNILSNVVK